MWLFCKEQPFSRAMYHIPIVLINRYVELFDIDPETILEVDMMQNVPERVLIGWRCHQRIFETVWSTMSYNEQIRFKMRWVWNRMNSYERTVVFDRLFN